MGRSGSFNKRRSYRHEVEIVEQAEEAGLEADRCWGSNGQARSMPEDVDIIIAGGEICLQAKRARKIAQYLKPWDYSGAVTGIVTRGDRDPDNVVAVPLTHYLGLVSRLLELDGELPH